MIIGIDAFNAEQAITAWEDEGGSGTQTVERQMIGTVNQIAWAAQIKVQVENEFDRVRAALESAATKQSGRRRMDTQVMIEILEEKRGEVMAHEQAGYFIHEMLLFYRVAGFSFHAMWGDRLGWAGYWPVLALLIAMTFALTWLIDRIYRRVDACARRLAL